MIVRGVNCLLCYENIIFTSWKNQCIASYSFEKKVKTSLQCGPANSKFCKKRDVYFAAGHKFDCITYQIP